LLRNGMQIYAHFSNLQTQTEKKSIFFFFPLFSNDLHFGTMVNFC